MFKRDRRRNKSKSCQQSQSFSPCLSRDQRRTLRFETLEDRRLLYGVTFLTHGFTLDWASFEPDHWVSDLGDHVADRVASEHNNSTGENRQGIEVEQLYLQISHTPSVMPTEGNPFVVDDTFYYWNDTGPGSAVTDIDSVFQNSLDGEVVILLDWTESAGLWGVSPFAEVRTGLIADELASFFTTTIASQFLDAPWHLVGHSRGGSLVGALAEAFGTSGLWVDQVTFLDPHPMANEFGDSDDDWGDKGITVPDNVIYSDTYYRDDFDPLDFDGESVTGSQNTELSESYFGIPGSRGFAAEHSDVWLWYGGTIPETMPPAGVPIFDKLVTSDWYDPAAYESSDTGLTARSDTGYNSSRITDYGFPFSAPTFSAPSLANWANIGYLAPSNTLVSRGNDLTVDFYSDVPSGRTATVSFFLDSNQNPYDGLGDELIGTVVPAGGTLAAFNASIPISATLGNRYLVGKTSVNETGKSRYYYAGEIVNVASSSVLNDPWVSPTPGPHDSLTFIIDYSNPGSAPQSAQLLVDGTTYHDMTLIDGTADNGVYALTVVGLAAAPHDYDFVFVDAGGTTHVRSLYAEAEELQVLHVSPVDGGPMVVLDADVSITFSQEMNHATLDSTTVQVVGSSSGMHDGDYIYSGTTLDIDPFTDFDPGETVTVTVTQNALSFEGQQLAQEYVFSFNTLTSVPTPITVPSSITTSTTWTAGNVYLISSHVTVSFGVTLAIEGGTVVKFDESTSTWNLIVDGTLDLQSSPGNRVIFTSDRDDLYGGDSNGDGTATSPASDDWGGIELNNSSIDFHDTLVRYGGHGRDGQVEVNNATPIIRDSTFENGDNTNAIAYYAVSSYDSSPQITGITADRKIYVDGSTIANTTPSISGNTLTSSIYLRDVVAGTSVIGNTAAQIELYNTDPNVSVTGNILTGMEPIYLHQDGRANFSGNSYSNPKRIGVDGNITQDVTWSNIEGLNLPYHIYSHVTVDFGVTLAIEGGTVVKFDESTSTWNLIVDGTLDLQSSPGNRVIFTSDRDDLYGGDSNGDGTATSPASDDWGGIELNNSSIDFHDTLVRYGGHGRDGQVEVNNATPIIRDSTFENGDNTALAFLGSGSVGATVNNVNFLNTSQYGVNNSSGGTVDARNNWWGDASGPSGEGSGIGASVSTSVLFDPWLTSPAVSTASPSADFDTDSDVDGLDFLAWQRGFGTPAPTAQKTDGDADNNFNVDDNDLTVWKGQFGSIPAPAVAAVAVESEPATAGFQESQIAAAAVESLLAGLPTETILVSEQMLAASSVELQAATNNPQPLSSDLVDAAIDVDFASRSRTKALSAYSAPLREDQFDWISHSTRWSQEAAWHGSSEIASSATRGHTFNIEEGILNRNADVETVTEDLVDELFADEEFGLLL